MSVYPQTDGPFTDLLLIIILLTFVDECFDRVQRLNAGHILTNLYTSQILAALTWDLELKTSIFIHSINICTLNLFVRIKN